MSLFLQTTIKNPMFLLYLLIFSFSILSGCEENPSTVQNWQNVKTSDLPKSPDQSIADFQVINTSDSRITDDQQLDQQFDQQLIPSDMTLTDFAQDAQLPKVSRPNLCGAKVEMPVDSTQDFSYVITDGALIDTKIEFPSQTFASNVTLVIDCQMNLLAQYLLIEDLSTLDLSQMMDINQAVASLKPLSPQLILSIQGDHPDLKPSKKIKITHSYDASTAPDPFKAKAIRLLAQPKIQANAQIINPPMLNPVFDLHQGLVTY